MPGSRQLALAFGFTDCRCQALVFAMAFSITGACKTCGKGPIWEGVWPFLDPWDVVGLRTTASVQNVPVTYGPHGELFFFLTKKEPLALTKAVEFRPLVRAETLRACALIGLHLRAAESASASSGSQSHDLGGAWRCGCPKSLDWDRDVESWTESEGTSSSDECEHNVESLALNAVGQNWSGDKISLFLEDWELARVALSCHIALQCAKAILSPWKGCDSKVRSVVRELKGWGRRRRSEAWCPFLSSEEPGLQVGIFRRNSVVLS